MAVINRIILFLITFTLILFGCSENVPTEEASTPQTPAEENRVIDETTINLYQFDPPTEEQKEALIKTSAGDITIIFFPSEAPMAVENFILLAESGYYNGLRFNKVVTDWFIQSGDPEDGTGGRSIWDKPFENEISYNLWNFSGAVGMASTDENGNGSQFYIVSDIPIGDATIEQMEEALYPSKVVSKYEEEGGAPWLDGKQTVFAQVIDGMEIVNEISATPTDENNMPKSDIIIESITIR